MIYRPNNGVSLQEDSLYSILSDYTMIKRIAFLDSPFESLTDLGSTDYWKENIKYISPEISEVEDKSEDSANYRVCTGEYVLTKPKEIKYRFKFDVILSVYEKLKSFSNSNYRIALIDYYNNVYLLPVWSTDHYEYYGLECGYCNVNTFSFADGITMDLFISRSNDFSKLRAYKLDWDVQETNITAPTLSSVVVTGITDSEAILTSSVTDDGSGTITEKGFYVSVHELPNITGQKYTDSDLSLALSLLTGGTRYHICSYAINESGEGISSYTYFSTNVLVYSEDFGISTYLTNKNTLNPTEYILYPSSWNVIYGISNLDVTANIVVDSSPSGFHLLTNRGSNGYNIDTQGVYYLIKPINTIKSKRYTVYLDYNYLTKSNCSPSDNNALWVEMETWRGEIDLSTIPLGHGQIKIEFLSYSTHSTTLEIWRQWRDVNSISNYVDDITIESIRVVRTS